jgi:hypothetical protein
VKKRILIGVFVGIAFLGNVSTASPEAAFPAPTPSAPPTEVINDVSVPYPILLDIQAEFQGYAVRSARQYVRAGQHVFALRITTSDSGGGGFDLLFDTEWKYLGRERVTEPSPKPQASATEVPAMPSIAPEPEAGQSDEEAADPEEHEQPDEEEPTPTNEDERPRVRRED